MSGHPEPWPEREIWRLLDRADLALRDELLNAWAERDAALARIAAVEADLVTLYESLPFGHPEKPGIWRALEVVRLTTRETTS